MTRSKSEGRFSARPVTAPPSWWNTLAFRLALVVNLAVIAVLGGFGVIEYRREEIAQMRPEIARLREEARLLRVAWDHLQDARAFQRFVDEFCQQMSSAASPGHHIAVFDDTGKLVARAHERANPAVEAKMATGEQASVVRFQHGGEPFVSVSVKAREGATIAVAQSLALAEQFLHVQRVSRASSMAILVLLIFGVTTIALLVWVRDPLKHLSAAVSAVGQRRFDFRVQPSGNSELRYLANGVNAMIQSLEQVERGREMEMRRAREIQRSLLPRDGSKADGFEIAATFTPTDAVGGDLYDIVKLKDGSTLLAVLDVSGHGVPAALYTALLRTVLRQHASQTSDVGRIADAMNSELADIATPGRFATCLLARLTTGPNAVEHASAGHPPAIIIGRDGQRELTNGPTLPLGVESGTRYEVGRALLDRDDRLFLFTDGIYEVFDQQDHQLGLAGFVDLLVRTSRFPVREQLDAVIGELRSFQRRDRFDDDVTLVCARCK